MSDGSTVYLYPYRSDGVTHTARIRATSVADAARRMRNLDWAPGCGPIGLPRPMEAPAPQRLSLATQLQHAFMRWAAQ